MKISQAIFLILASVVITIAVGFFIFNPKGTGTTSAPTHKETAYERVMRTGVLRCGYISTPPLWDVDPNTREVTGLMKDLSDKVAGLLDLKIDYLEITMGQQIADMMTGKIDAMCSDAPWVFTSMKYLDYTTPFFYGPIYAHVQENDKRLQNIDDLNLPDVRFGGIDSSATSTLVRFIFPKAKLSSMSANTDAASFMASLSMRKFDAIMIDPLSVERFNETNSPKLRTLKANGPVMVYGVGFSVLKGEDNLRTMLDDAVKNLLNMQGVVETISQKYDPNGTLIYPKAKPYEVRK